MTVTSPARPVLTLVPPWTAPDHRHGFGWRWFQVRQAWESIRWHVLTAVSAMVATVSPGVRGQAWREGFDVALGARSARTWRDHVGEWRQGNEVAAEIVWRRHGQRWDGRRLTLCCPFVLPDPAALSNVASGLAGEQLTRALEWQAATAADQGRHPAARHGWRGRRWRRIWPAVAVMATAAVAADSHRVTALADAAGVRRIAGADGRHAGAGTGHGRGQPDRRQPPGRHARPAWRAVAEGGRR